MSAGAAPAADTMLEAYTSMREVWLGYANDEGLPEHWRERGRSKVAEYDKLIAERAAQ